jgi:hypothetical protein
MSCTHKFFEHEFHGKGNSGLLPSWNYNTLIIGTFNPENSWKADNSAKYFYGRSRNYFWKILPHFTSARPEIKTAIDYQNINHQREFLKANNIGITDILTKINDADITNEIHKSWISSVKDSDIEKFSNFNWNTDNIINELKKKKIQAVYFSKLGTPTKITYENTFEGQMRLIESFCRQNNIICHRLHTPSGQGLGAGNRVNNLINRWYNQNGGDSFPFLNPAFDISNYR